MQETKYSVGPKFFGTTAKKSWFDEGDRCAPGPGAHDPQRLNQTNPPNWTVGKDEERDSFLDKYHRPYPSPDAYKIVDANKNHIEEPKYSIPVYEPEDNPNKIDEGNSLDYRPKYNVPKVKYPDYSFGYHFERDYSSAVPPPNNYNPTIIDRKAFNKTQRSFSIGGRPAPYGEEGKYPYVGKYNVGSNMGGTKYSFGKGNRPYQVVGASPGKFYEVKNEFKQGKTIGLLIEVPKNKDHQEFPSPDKYNPLLPKTGRNIINFKGDRSEIRDIAVENNPSPDRYQLTQIPKSQTVSFTKEKRYSPEPNDNPGVGTYQVQKKFNTNLGHMAFKLKKLAQFVNPAPSAYEPKDDLTKPTSQRPVNLYSDRTDFSKSITGRVGPGVYEVKKKDSSSLGKMGKSLKFQPNRNVNPGPGSYQIPNSIGKLPKYCSGPKKLTDTGFSCLELDRQERIEKVRAKQRIKQEQQQLAQEKALEEMQKKESERLKE